MQSRLSPMLISEELLDEFKELYKEEFDKQLTDREALDRAMDVLQVFKAVYRPIPRGKRDEYRRIRELYE